MDKTRKFLAYLAGATITASSGVAGATLPEVINFDTNVADTEVEQTTDADIADGDRYSTIESRAKALSTAINTLTKPPVTRLIADGLSFEAIEPLLDKLSEHDRFVQADAIAQTMASFLEEVGGITRTRVISEWTISDSTAKRLIITKVLAHPFYCLGSAGAAAILASDPVVNIRRTLVDTIVSRMKENPDHYRGILTRLSTDRARKVRRAARKAMQTLPSIPMS